MFVYNISQIDVEKIVCTAPTEVFGEWINVASRHFDSLRTMGEQRERASVKLIAEGRCLHERKRANL